MQHKIASISMGLLIGLPFLPAKALWLPTWRDVTACVSGAVTVAVLGLVVSRCWSTSLSVQQKEKLESFQKIEREAEKCGISTSDIATRVLPDYCSVRAWIAHDYFGLAVDKPNRVKDYDTQKTQNYNAFHNAGVADFVHGEKYKQFLVPSIGVCVGLVEEGKVRSLSKIPFKDTAAYKAIFGAGPQWKVVAGKS